MTNDENGTTLPQVIDSTETKLLKLLNEMPECGQLKEMLQQFPPQKQFEGIVTMMEMVAPGIELKQSEEYSNAMEGLEIFKQYMVGEFIKYFSERKKE